MQIVKNGVKDKVFMTNFWHNINSDIFDKYDQTDENLVSAGTQECEQNDIILFI